VCFNNYLLLILYLLKTWRCKKGSNYKHLQVWYASIMSNVFLITHF
jgi:hypothetical protein